MMKRAKTAPRYKLKDEDDDGDGVLDAGDNCPVDVNPEQINTDGDSAGDVCDLDDDNDGFTDAEELEAGTDPNDPNDQPVQSSLPIWLLYEATQP